MNNFGLKKYYTFIVVAILIIALSVSLGTYKLKLDNTPPSVKSDDENIQEIEDMIDDDFDEHDETSMPTNVKNYTKATAYECVDTAIKQLLNSKGYRAVFQTSCKIYVAGTEFANQTATEEIISSGNYYLKKTMATCNNSLGKNFYSYFYSNNNLETLEYKKTTKYSSDGIPNWSGTETDITAPFAEIKEKYDPYSGVLFTIRPTEKTAITSFDKFSNEKYYIIKFALTPSEIPEEYMNYVKWQGDLVGANIKTMSFSFYIEKATLNIRKVERRESYKAQKTENLGGDCELITSISFPTINKEIIPEKPLEHF